MDRKIGDTNQESSLHHGNVSFFPFKEAHFYACSLLAMTSLRNSWAVVGGIISQADREVRALRKLYEPLHELSAPTMALWTVIQIDEHGRDVGKALFDALPPVDQPIHQAIAGHFGPHPIQKEFIGDGQENTHGCHRRCWLKVVVSCLGGHATLSSSSKRADLDHGLGIHRESQNVLITICLLVRLLHLGKDGISFGEFFWG